MADAWGGSWGTNWALSWGAVAGGGEVVVRGGGGGYLPDHIRKAIDADRKRVEEYAEALLRKKLKKDAAEERRLAALWDSINGVNAPQVSAQTEVPAPVIAPPPQNIIDFAANAKRQRDAAQAKAELIALIEAHLALSEAVLAQQQADDETMAIVLLMAA